MSRAYPTSDLVVFVSDNESWVDARRGSTAVGEHLADQLLLPMALGSGGAFRTLEPSLHCTTQLRLLGDILGTKATAVEEQKDVWRIEVEAARA